MAHDPFHPTQSQANRQHHVFWWLYLVNLLLAPGFAALILIVLLIREGNNPATKRVFMALSICAVALLILPLAMWSLFDKTGMFWVFFICYWVTAHAACILLGVLGLVGKAK